ncbi:MAG: RelA/SpoT family protein [Bacteroidales bacterium]|nr:RelA/SpoT family protein [Bacteroidales bacterium]
MNTREVSLPERAQEWLDNYLTTVPEVEATQIRMKNSELIPIITGELGLGDTSHAACLLTVPYNRDWLTAAQVEENFCLPMVNILVGLKKIEKLNTTRTKIHADKFIQLLLSISDDVRVILIKTGMRLQELRSADELTDEARLKLAQEAGDLYAPIAHRLGLYQIKNEFEEASMKNLLPDIHRDISRHLAETRSNRDEYIEKFIKPLANELKSKGYLCDIKGRTKSIPSIWRKMVSQAVEFDEVYDLFAIRIILKNPSENEKADCWQVYSIVTDLYQPNPNRLRDWISSPKPNGYESLHTTVIGQEGRWVEVQIRTQRMDVIAEKGHAAHWRYKENNGDTEGAEWLSEIRDALETIREPEKVVESKAKNELYSDQIYIFTPKGDLLKLKAGSTVLDFAFAVHSDVGYHCTGAKVNNQMVPIRQKLVNGDQVEVTVSQQQKPKIDWLNWVSSSIAKSRIKRFLNEANYQDADIGKEILARKLSQWKIKPDVSTLQRIVNWLNLKDALELYQQISESKIELASIRDFLKDKAPSEILKDKIVSPKTVDGLVKVTSQSQDYLVIDDSLGNVDYKLSKCCNPIFGDEVFGFVTVHEGTKIHRVSCSNARQMIERYPYRVVKVRWTDSHGATAGFTINLQITGKDNIAVVNEISKIIASDLKVSMRSMNLVSKDGQFEGTYTLIVQVRPHLETIMNRIRRTKGVLSIRRSDEQTL